MTTAQMRKRAHALMVKHERDILSLDMNTTFKLGLEYITLKGNDDIEGINFDEAYVPIADEDINAVYKGIRVALNEMHLFELSEKDVERLERQITFGSLYYADYENTFGVDCHEVAAYADGYLETQENPEELGEYETFYDYIQSTEWFE